MMFLLILCCAVLSHKSLVEGNNRLATYNTRISTGIAILQLVITALLAALTDFDLGWRRLPPLGAKFSSL